MTKPYKIVSWGYRIILGFFIVIFTLKSLIFPETNQNSDNYGLWSLLFSIVTLITISIFHRLGNDSWYKVFVQVFVCILVLISLGFLSFLFSNGEDGNLLVNAVLVLMISVNAVLLFYVTQDTKFNRND